MKKRILTALSLSVIAAGTACGQHASITVDASRVENTITPWLYGACMEDVNHEIYGGLYDQRIFGESFEEPIPSDRVEGFSRYEGNWKVAGKELRVKSAAGAKLVYDRAEVDNGYVEADIRFDNERGTSAAILLRVTDPGRGADNFNGYEVNLQNSGKKAILGKHRMNWEPLAEADIDIDPGKWNRLGIKLDGPRIQIFVNGKLVLSHIDTENPLLTGKVALRTWHADVGFRNLSIEPADAAGKKETVDFNSEKLPQISGMWDAVCTPGAKAVFAHDGTDAYNTAHSQMIQMTGGKGRVGIANRGLNRWGIAVRDGQKFAGSLYLKSSGRATKVIVALQSADGSRQYAAQEIGGLSAKWTEYPFELTCTATDDNARFAIYLETPGKVWVDQATLMSTGDDQFRGLPLRNDIGQAMVDEGLTFLRYGGTMINAPEYRFKKMIGDRAGRPTYKGHWYPYSTNGFGIEEFLQFCEAAGFTPSFAVNVEESPEDMADMIEYLNGPADSPWGSKRAQAGHPEPYNVKYIEIGNEEVIWGNNKKDYEHYIERFNLLYDAMKAKDPNLVFINAAWWRPNALDNMEMVFRALDGKAAYWDYHPWADGLNSGANVMRELGQMREMFHKWNPDTEMKCALFEENGNTHNMQRALGHVTIQNAARRFGDFLLTTCAANALQPYRQNDNGWDQGQVFFTPSQVWGMPPYYAQQMAAGVHKPLRVFSDTRSGLDVTATTDEQRGELVLHIANVKAESITAALDIKGFGEASRVRAITLAGELHDINTPEQPERIVQTEKTLRQPNDLVYDFPAYSYTILVFSK